MATLRAERSGATIPAGPRDFYPLHNFETGFGASPASSLVGTGGSARGLSGRGVRQATYLHLVPRLIMSGGLSPLPYMPSWRVQGQVLRFIQ